MSELVQRLCGGSHPVEVVSRADATVAALRDRIDTHGLVHLRFTNTRGGTELGVRLERDACRLSELESGTGTIRLVGSLTLDYVPVRCVADIDLRTLAGTGQLAVMDGNA